MYEKMNKLVRDNIPNIIEQKGDKPDFVILDSFDYYNELKKKLSEQLTGGLQTKVRSLALNKFHIIN